VTAQLGARTVADRPYVPVKERASVKPFCPCDGCALHVQRSVVQAGQDLRGGYGRHEVAATWTGSPPRARPAGRRRHPPPSLRFSLPVTVGQGRPHGRSFGLATFARSPGLDRVAPLGRSVGRPGRVRSAVRSVGQGRPLGRSVGRPGRGRSFGRTGSPPAPPTALPAGHLLDQGGRGSSWGRSGPSRVTYLEERVTLC
jgi:hypothetical protein